MDLLRIASTPPIGLAFEISDLILLQGWARFNDIRMIVELDHSAEGEEYEEVVAFYAKDSALRRGILWRSATEIVVQPLIGRTRRFGSVTGALDSMRRAGTDFPGRRPSAAESAASPRRSLKQPAAPRRAMHTGKVADSNASADNASFSVS